MENENAQSKRRPWCFEPWHFGRQDADACCPANNNGVAASQKKKGCSVDVAEQLPVPIGQTKVKEQHMSKTCF
jgi:hypothetical protein